MWTKPGREGWIGATSLASAATVLGHALQLTNGTLAPWPIRWLSLTILLALLAVLGLSLRWIEWADDHPAAVIVGTGIAASIAIQLTTSPGMYLRVPPTAFIEHHYWVAVAAVLAGASLSKDPWLGRIAFPALMVTHFCLGLWLLRASPSPLIDVYSWHQEAFHALGQGIDPYAITMPNIYGRTDWYAPGMADAVRVNVGYPYPPLSLLLAAPGHLLAGDYRYANLAAMTLSGGLIAYARPSRLARAVGALFLLTPRGLFVLEQGWTEANVVLMIAVTIFVACRFPRFLPYAFGLLLAVKQYMILTVPLALFFLPRPLQLSDALRFFGKAVAVAAAITIPLALWNIPAFVQSVVLFQSKQPFRADALSFLAATAQNGVPVLPLSLGFVMVLVALGIASWRCPRTPAGYAASTALLFLLFFAFSKQAFCNYYFMITGTLCVAAATMAPHRSTESEPLATSPASTAGASVPTGQS